MFANVYSDGKPSGGARLNERALPSTTDRRRNDGDGRILAVSTQLDEPPPRARNAAGTFASLTKQRREQGARNARRTACSGMQTSMFVRRLRCLHRTELIYIFGLMRIAKLRTKHEQRASDDSQAVRYLAATAN